MMFLITKEQVDKLAAVLLEIPAKISLQGIDVLRSLQPHVVSEVKQEEQVLQTEA